MENRIRNLILNGTTLSDIYTTITPRPTKELIVKIFKGIGFSILAQHGWDYLRIMMEKSLFSLHRKYNYCRNVIIDDLTIDYLIYEDGTPKLAIVILGQEFILCDDFPVFDEEYRKNIALIKMKSDYCDNRGFPLLKLPILELIDWPFLADEFRKALKDIDYAKEHNNWAEEEYIDISNLWMCDYENYHQVTASKKCGCFSCGSVIEANDAILWGQDSSMMCPICNKTTLISDFQGFKITPDTMNIIKEKYKETED